MKNTDQVKLPGAKAIPGAWLRVNPGIAPRGVIAKASDAQSSCPNPEHSDDCCCRHAVVLKGYGLQDFPFPSSDELVAGAVAYFNALSAQYEKMGQHLSIGGGSEEVELIAEASEHLARMQERFAFVQSILGSTPSHGLRTKAPHNSRALAASARGQARAAVKDAAGMAQVLNLIADAKGGTSETFGPVLRVGAGAFAQMMHKGRFKAAMAKQFDAYKGAVNWGLTSMPERYRPEKHRNWCLSLQAQIGKLEEIYAEALPRVIQFLGSQNPQAVEEELLQVAVSLLNEQVQDFLMVLGIYTDGLAQRRDGMYSQLDYVHFTVEQSLRLQSARAMKTKAFHIGDAFMARFSDQGPATIPGGRGPVGAHAIEVPFDEADMICLFLPLYLHEFRHDFYNDVDGLQESMTEVVLKAITKANEDGKFKFSSETVKFGKQSVRMIDLMMQVYGQTLSETDADIAGGVMLSGEAFMYSMLATFCAFNMRGYDVSAFEINRMLRHSSYFAVSEEGELAIAPHMPDFMRALVLAAALECLGFKAEADECRRLARQAAGVPVPEYIIWRNIDPNSKFKFEIKLRVSDLEQVAPVVADAIINAPLEALGGLSTSQLVNWTRKRQNMVDALVANLLAGKADIPWELGDYVGRPNYVAAATIKAAWALWKSGELAPVTAALFIEGNARKMLDAVKAKTEEREEQERQAASKPAVEPATAAPTVQPSEPVAKEGDGSASPPAAPPARESDATGGSSSSLE